MACSLFAGHPPPHHNTSPALRPELAYPAGPRVLQPPVIATMHRMGGQVGNGNFDSPDSRSAWLRRAEEISHIHEQVPTQAYRDSNVTDTRSTAATAVPPQRRTSDRLRHKRRAIEARTPVVCTGGGVYWRTKQQRSFGVCMLC